MKTPKLAIYCFLFFLLSLFSHAVTIADNTLFDKRLDRWKAQAEKGDHHAQYKLGLAYLNGNEVKVDIAQAVIWFEKSAAQDYAKAAHKLGLIYFNNQDGSRDYSKAYRWFMKAADKRYPPAQFHLAQMYFEGKGVSRSLEKSLFWAQLAESNDHIKSKALISEIEEALKNAKTAGIAGKTKKPPRKPEKEKTEPVAHRSTAPIISVKESPRTTTEHPHIFNTREIIYGGSWSLNGNPAEHMPSGINPCKDDGKTLSCLSLRISGKTDGAKVDYQVKTTLSDFLPTGSFVIAYQRNNIMVVPNDPDDPNPDSDVPTAGWQKTTSKLRCRVLSKTSAQCYTDDLRVENYSK